MRTASLFALCLSILAPGRSSRGDRHADSSAGAVDTTHALTANAAGAGGVLRGVAATWGMIARPTAG